MPSTTHHHQAAFRRLGQLLDGLGWLWRPTPFHQPRPDWCAALPALTRQLLALEEAQLEHLADHLPALLALLAPHVPELTELAELCALPAPAPPADTDLGRLAWGMPGRKRQQIEHFAAAVGRPRAAPLEWCAGKGHLGRLLAVRWGLPVTSLELDAGLCAAGRALARRACAAQRFLQADALEPAAAGHLADRHAMALHACGDLHLALLRGAVSGGAVALDLAPCCYYRIASPRYQPLNPEAALSLSRDELHLPVTETLTAGARERRLRDRAMAWKLGFLALRGELAGVTPRPNFRPVPAAWFHGGFEAFCRRLAAREGLAVPASLDLAPYEARGWQRRRQVVRLDLPRLAFRRALELWLALDRALFLERAGYAVRLVEFCPRAVTPRNLLISARR